MATLPTIILKSGQILLTDSISGTGITMDNSPFIFGTVQIVNDLTEMYAVNDSVLFDPTGATRFIYDEVNYYLTTEDKVYFTETSLP